MDFKAHLSGTRQNFSQEVKQNAEQDRKKLGIRILSFNVQKRHDQDGLDR